VLACVPARALARRGRVILLMGIVLIYAELGAAYPVSGGTARFTWIHAGTLGGFCCGTYAGYLGPAGRLRPWRPPPAGRR
jgi:hypothetical protein